MTSIKMTVTRRPLLLAGAALLGLVCALPNISEAADGVVFGQDSETIPIIDRADDVELCDEEEVVLVIDGDDFYLEIETDAGPEWHTIPGGVIHFGLHQGEPMTVVFDDVDHLDRDGEPKELYVSADDQAEAEVRLRGGIGDYVLYDSGWVYEFDWRLVDPQHSPVGPDVVFEPSTNCPPPKVDDPPQDG